MILTRSLARLLNPSSIAFIGGGECDIAIRRTLELGFTGTIYELLSAPISPFEIACGYVGAAATKSIILGIIILATAGFFVPLQIAHPVWMVAFLVLTAVTPSMVSNSRNTALRMGPGCWRIQAPKSSRYQLWLCV